MPAFIIGALIGGCALGFLGWAVGDSQGPDAGCLIGLIGFVVGALLGAFIAFLL